MLASMRAQLRSKLRHHIDVFRAGLGQIRVGQQVTLAYAIAALGFNNMTMEWI